MNEKRIMKMGRVFCVTLVALLLTVAAIFTAQATNIRPTGRFAFVTNEGDNNLMVVNLTTDEVVKTLPTGKVPHALVFTRDGKGYVNNRGEQSLTVIDGNSQTVLKTIALPAISMQIALSPDNKTLAVGYKDALKITLIDTVTDTVIATLDIGADRSGKKPVRIKHPFWSQDGRFVYAGDNLNNTVVKIDAATHRIAATIPMPATTHHFAADPTGKYIYVVQGKGKDGRLSVTVLDAADDHVVKTIFVPMVAGEKSFGHHGAFSPDRKFFYFCNEGGKTVAIIDISELTVVKTLQAGQGAGHPVFTRDGSKVYVINHHDNIVTVIDTVEQKVVKHIQAGTGKKEGHSAYMAPDGHFYMLNATDGAIIKIDTASMKVRSEIKVGRKPMIMVVR